MVDLGGHGCVGVSTGETDGFGGCWGFVGGSDVDGLGLRSQRCCIQLARGSAALDEMSRGRRERGPGRLDRATEPFAGGDAIRADW